MTDIRFRNVVLKGTIDFAPETDLLENVPTRKGRGAVCRDGMKYLGTWVSKDGHRWLKREALDHNTTMDALLAHALELLYNERSNS